MAEYGKGKERIHRPRVADDGSDSTLLPMLIAGLVLIVVGAIVVMSIV